MAKAVKKQWVEISAPSSFKVQTIGESFVESAEKLVGRSINVNLMNLTNDPKTQNIRMDFKVIGAKGDRTQTRATSYKISPASIKRLVRRGSSRIDDSFVCRTKDGVTVRVKPFLVTRSKVNKRLASALRKSAKTYLETTIEKTPYDNLVDLIVGYRIQREMRRILGKLYPLKACEVRSIEIIDSKKHVEEPVKKQVKKEFKTEKKEEVEETKEKKVEVKAEEKVEKEESKKSKN